MRRQPWFKLAGTSISRVEIAGGNRQAQQRIHRSRASRWNDGLAREYDRNIDLLLTDVVMPEMNVKELSERIPEFMPGLKHIYMSGYTADVIARQAFLIEGGKFPSKPFSLKDLADKIKETLDE